MLDRLSVITTQIKAVEEERDEALEQNQAVQLLLKLRSLGPETTSCLWLECFYREFASRRHLAAYGGLAGTPFQSGTISREQGITRSGNPRVRRAMIELAWQWLRYQPDSELSRWFVERVGTQRGRVRRIAIVAMARKLLVALWHYVNDGTVPAGAVFKAG